MYIFKNHILPFESGTWYNYSSTDCLAMLLQKIPAEQFAYVQVHRPLNHVTPFTHPPLIPKLVICRKEISKDPAFK